MFRRLRDSFRWSPRNPGQTSTPKDQDSNPRNQEVNIVSPEQRSTTAQAGGSDSPPPPPIVPSVISSADGSVETVVGGGPGTAGQNPTPSTLTAVKTQDSGVGQSTLPDNVTVRRGGDRYSPPSDSLAFDTLTA